MEPIVLTLPPHLPEPRKPTMLRLPAELHKQARELARLRRQPLATVITDVLTQAVPHFLAGEVSRASLIAAG